MELVAQPDLQGQRHGLRRRRPTCSSASRSSSCVVRFRATAGARSSPSTTTASTSTARTTSSRAGATAASTSPTPTTGAGTTGSARSERDGSATRGVYRVADRAAARPSSCVAGRVRPAERPVLLARRVAALRQRLAARPHQGVRRRARRHALGGRDLPRGDRRRREEDEADRRPPPRAARRRALSTGWSATSSATSGSPGPAASGCSTPGRRAHRHHRDARGRAAASLGRRRPAHAVPDDVDDRPHGRDARRARRRCLSLSSCPARRCPRSPWSRRVTQPVGGARRRRRGRRRRLGARRRGHGCGGRVACPRAREGARDGRDDAQVQQAASVVPDNHHMRALGLPDSRDGALRYIGRTSRPQTYSPRARPHLGLPAWEHELLVLFYDEGGAGPSASLEEHGRVLHPTDGRLPQLLLHGAGGRPQDSAGRSGRAGPRRRAPGDGPEMIAQLSAALEARGGRIVVEHRVQRVVMDGARSPGSRPPRPTGPPTASARARR